MKLLIEAAAKRWERDHNARVWLAWHVAAFQRLKKLPNLKKLMVDNTSKRRQTWREQMSVMTKWAADHNRMEKLREQMNGR